MKTFIISVVCFLCSGCSLTPAQQRVAGIVAGVLIIGAAKAHKEERGADQRVPTPRVDCVSDPEVCR